MPGITPSAIMIAERFAEHLARINSLEHNHEEAVIERRSLSAKLDKLQFWIMTTLGVAVVGFLAQLIRTR